MTEKQKCVWISHDLKPVEAFHTPQGRLTLTALNLKHVFLYWTSRSTRNTADVMMLSSQTHTGTRFTCTRELILPSHTHAVQSLVEFLWQACQTHGGAGSVFTSQVVHVTHTLINTLSLTHTHRVLKAEESSRALTHRLVFSKSN